MFAYDLSKQLELEDLDNELWLEEYKKKKRAHIQEIVDASMLTEQEKEWMEEYASEFLPYPKHDPANRFVERVVMPNLFDMRRNSCVFTTSKVNTNRKIEPTTSKTNRGIPANSS